jgi:Protein of unknown function (DUF2585)
MSSLLKNKQTIRTIVGVVIILAVMATVEHFEGRLAICACGYVKLWHGLVVSSGNSQHLFDLYSLTHVLHGLLIYLLLWIVDRKKKLSVTTKLLLAVGLEASWEILENSNMVINRYRAATISLDYFGDSIVNSIGDIISMALGFMIAARTKPWMSVALYIVVETLLAIVIRDNLTINIIMLIHPIEAIKIWQGVVAL